MAFEIDRSIPARVIAATVVLLIMITACASDGPSAAPGTTAPPPSIGPALVTTTTPPSIGTEGGTLLAAPNGTDPATMSAAADIVRARLQRMGVTDATVVAQPEGVSVQSSADPYQLRAAAQQEATSIAAVTSSQLGPCSGSGLGTAGDAIRCVTVGPALTGVDAVTAADVQQTEGAGWKVAMTIDPAMYKAFRAALEPAAGSTLAIVADGSVVLTFDWGVPALQSAIGPPLAEDRARHAAAALTVSSTLPVALEAPALPTTASARVGLDFWTAAIGVHICGVWLPNAPSFGLETGVHSHGDGLVYVHPVEADEEGDRATLGLFVERGGWAVSADELRLWDGATHRTGETCPDGLPATVRWWLDGVEQRGNPAEFAPRNGQVIVLGFDSDAAPPGVPPQMSSLFLPALGADT
jgi:hypothetical protein